MDDWAQKLKGLLELASERPLELDLRLGGKAVVHVRAEGERVTVDVRAPDELGELVRVARGVAGGARPR